MKNTVEELLSHLSDDDYRAIDQRAQKIKKSLKNDPQRNSRAYVQAYHEYMEFAYESAEMVENGQLIDENGKIIGKPH